MRKNVRAVNDESGNNNGKKLCGIKARRILYLMIFTGSVVMFIFSSDMFVIVVLLNNFTKNSSGIYHKENSRFFWEPRFENLITGLYFLGHSIMQFASLWFMGRVHMKLPIGIGYLVASSCKLIYMFLSETEVYTVIFLRLVEGLATGMFYTMVFQTLRTWVPPHEQAFFVTAFQASKLGVAITFFSYRYIYLALNWTGLFYTSGFIGIIWSVIWLLIISNSPNECKYISAEEIQYIEEHCSGEDENNLVPWYNIIKCPTIISLILTSMGGKFIYGIFLIYSPVYVYRQMGIRNFGPIIASPYFLSFLMTFIFLKIQNLINYSTFCLSGFGQRVFVIITLIIPGAMVLSLSFFDYSNLYLMICFCVVVLCTSQTNHLDILQKICPNFYIHVSAYIHTLHMVTPFLSTIFVGEFRQLDLVGNDMWQPIFFYSGLTTIISCIPFLLFAQLKLKNWNYYGGPRHSAMYAQNRANQVNQMISLGEQLKSKNRKKLGRNEPKNKERASVFDRKKDDEDDEYGDDWARPSLSLRRDTRTSEARRSYRK